MRLTPSEICYSQDTISNRWRDDKNSRHGKTYIGETLDDICEGRCTVGNIPTISVMNNGGKWVTADNRRLWVFRHLERLGKCETVPVSITYSIRDKKMTSCNGGISVSVRRNPGGLWHLHTSAPATKRLELAKSKEEMSKPKRHLVCAIDFGTAYSGWAYSFKHEYEKDPTQGYIRQWHSGSTSSCTEKTPTVALISPDGRTLVAFGYEAENEYKRLMETNAHKQYYLFCRFKMTLYKKLGEGITRNIVLEDEQGRQLPALNVFSMSIKYLADDLKENIRQKVGEPFHDSYIEWVLTVPAIWTDAAKQFMREAATKAGISSDRLTLALEPEVASLLCRQLKSDTKAVDGEVHRPALSSKYLIFDAGGGTVDITLHHVGTSDTLREVKPACGADCGGAMVDLSLHNIIIDIVGKDVYTKFTETANFMDFKREFEFKKREAGRSQREQIAVRMPRTLIEIYQDETNRQLMDAVLMSRYSGVISLECDTLRFDATFFESLFVTSTTNALLEVKKILQNEDISAVHAIYMVGGYAQSPVLQKRMQEAYPTLNVVIPHDASTCVLKGALIYGHNPTTISERVLKYTYGIKGRRTFDPNVHPTSKRCVTDKGLRCGNVFSILAKQGQTVRTGKIQERRTYTAPLKHQQSLQIAIFASNIESPRFVDEPGCRKIGKTNIVFEAPHMMEYPKVTVCLTFSGTEIVIETVEVATGQKITSNINFLG